MQQALQEKLGHKLKVGLRWKGIDEENRVQYEDKIRALHVQCEASTVRHIIEALQNQWVPH